jgi:ribosomal protein L37AE/L43A
MNLHDAAHIAYPLREPMSISQVTLTIWRCDDCGAEREQERMPLDFRALGMVGHRCGYCHDKHIERENAHLAECREAGK